MGLSPGDRRAEANENWLLRSNALKCHSLVTEFLPMFMLANDRPDVDWRGLPINPEP